VIIQCAAVGLAAEPKVLALVQGAGSVSYPSYGTSPIWRGPKAIRRGAKGPVGPLGPLALAAPRHTVEEGAGDGLVAVLVVEEAGHGRPRPEARRALDRLAKRHRARHPWLRAFGPDEVRDLKVGFGRIVASERDVPIILANMVGSG
jgi:hypothetical protein